MNRWKWKTMSDKKIINSALPFFFITILVFLVKTELSSCIILNSQLLIFYEILYVWMRISGIFNGWWVQTACIQVSWYTQGTLIELFRPYTSKLSLSNPIWLFKHTWYVFFLFHTVSCKLLNFDKNAIELWGILKKALESLKHWKVVFNTW